jgi:hypothetical protein
MHSHLSCAVKAGLEAETFTRRLSFADAQRFVDHVDHVDHAAHAEDGAGRRLTRDFPIAALGYHREAV